ncbi:unnamed protein product [Rotaria sordida]|uniref:Uncharacterized protein n=1 Tax=Rotaria sordida TaxID=392033 RepID=A0A813RVT1_9BILA|nr:unnamed protein product [Rotaria sordida]
MLVVILFLFAHIRIASSIFCNDGSNPCKLDQQGSTHSYFLPINGYHCLDAVNGEFICTCPDSSTTRNQPCRICDRQPNPCGVGPSVVACTDINQSFVCLCKNEQGELIHSTMPCGTFLKKYFPKENNLFSIILGNYIVTTPPENKCQNKGVRDPTTNLCNCPSGFTGSKCETRADKQLCDKIECMSNGACAIRPIFDGATTYQSVCLCRAGYDGDYCEWRSTIGSCTVSYCLHGGICQRRQIGSSKYIYCQCKPGWAGSRCETQYFHCESSGYFIDEHMRNQGKYFSCISFDDDYLLLQLSCPKGLKFDPKKQLCLQ